jgi:putative transposase
MVKRPRPPSPTWRAFLRSHLKDMISIDFFTVPTVRHHVLFVFIVLAHERRRVLHFNITANPSAEWTAQQMVEALPWDTSPAHLLRDRDKIYGDRFRQRVEGLGMEEIVTSYQSPWQNPFVERLIGTLRRECLDHLIVLNERHLRRALTAYLSYCHGCRTHMSLDMDCPERRRVQGLDQGEVISIPEVFGLHHRYERWAA